MTRRAFYAALLALFILSTAACDENNDGQHDTNADIEAACAPGGSAYPCLGGNGNPTPPGDDEDSCWDCH